MKRLLTFSILAVLATVLFASCSKRDHYDNNYGKENGIVEYEPEGYEYYSVVRLYDTYAFIETLENDESYWPYEGDQLRGTFDKNRDNRVFNVTRNRNITVQIRGFYDTQSQAILAVENYINQYGYSSKNGIQRSSRSNQKAIIK